MAFQLLPGTTVTSAAVAAAVAAADTSAASATVAATGSAAAHPPPLCLFCGVRRVQREALHARIEFRPARAVRRCKLSHTRAGHPWSARAERAGQRANDERMNERASERANERVGLIGVFLENGRRVVYESG